MPPRRWSWPQFNLQWLFIFVLGLGAGLSVWRLKFGLWDSLGACFLAWIAVGLIQTSCAAFRQWRDERAAPQGRQFYLALAMLWPLGTLLLVMTYLTFRIGYEQKWLVFSGHDGFFGGDALRDAPLYAAIVLAFCNWLPAAKRPWTNRGLVKSILGTIAALVWCLLVVRNTIMVPVLVHIAIRGLENSLPMRWGGRVLYPENMQLELTSLFHHRAAVAALLLAGAVAGLLMLSKSWHSTRQRQLAALTLWMACGIGAAWLVHWCGSLALPRLSPFLAGQMPGAPVASKVAGGLLLLTISLATGYRLAVVRGPLGTVEESSGQPPPALPFHYGLIAMLTICLALIGKSVSEWWWADWSYNDLFSIDAAWSLLAKWFWQWFEFLQGQLSEPSFLFRTAALVTVVVALFRRRQYDPLALADELPPGKFLTMTVLSLVTWLLAVPILAWFAVSAYFVTAAW